MTLSEKDLEEVAKKYMLTKEDVFLHKDGWKIISANGIRHIIAIDKIETTKYLSFYDPVIPAAVVRCQATVRPRSLDSFSQESLGEATNRNSTYLNYVVNVAEKRAEGRAVLNVIGLYHKGWRAEEEFDETIEGAKIIQKRREQSQAAIADSIEKIEKPKVTKRALSAKNKDAE